METPTAVVVGASGGVGRALADALARRGFDLVLTARSTRDLEAVAADVAMRYGRRAVPLPLDLGAPGEEIAGWHARCAAVLPRIDAVLVTVGAVDDADDGVSDWQLTESLIDTNFVAVARLVRPFLGEFERRGAGTLVVFSSIAAAAPRRRNVGYAAGKAALESYARSLQHRYAGSAIRVQVYALGYVDTAMTRGRELRLPVADPARVADTIADGLFRSRRFRYLPGFWGPIVAILRRLPWRIYRRLDF